MVQGVGQVEGGEGEGKALHEWDSRYSVSTMSGTDFKL